MTYAEPVPKTLEEHREYLYKIVRLKLFYLHLNLTELHPEESFTTAIRSRVDIYRKTAANPGPHTPKELFFDAPAWKTMEDAAQACFEANRHDRAAFEEEAFDIFRASIDARCERDFLDNSVIANYQCGSLKHEYALNEDGCLGFHIGNAVRPHSFFDDPLYLPRCFRALLRVAEELYRAQGIFTDSWLNSNPKWLAEFPDEWQKNLSAPRTNVNWSYGWWGQFISARGTFNDKLGKALRDTGKFPYPPRQSHCSLDAMKSRVASILDR